MERDRLRREVRALENRLQLSSELSEQSSLLSGVDPRSLRALGFVAPDPSHIVDIDLKGALPRAVQHGVAARLSSWRARASSESFCMSSIFPFPTRQGNRRIHRTTLHPQPDLRADEMPGWVVVTSDDPATEPQTWHHGVVARWWAEFNEGGEEIDYFRRYVEAGQPALDVACGTGRLLLPYLRAGLDVDGCDISEDMLALCREAAARESLTPALYAQAMHELDLPRRYRTIFVCGGLGLGSSREQDLEALRRLHEHLEPGGVLLLDNEVPYADAGLWKYWLKESRAELPAGEHDGPRGQRAHDRAAVLVPLVVVAERAPLSRRNRPHVSALRVVGEQAGWPHETESHHRRHQ
jgi:SAM-dependent methyltransferase